MAIRRVFAGSIVALLLFVSSLAVACDLSCAFASKKSDCHAQQAEPQDSASGGMQMDGMAMAEMTMPEMANGVDQQADPALSRPNARHPRHSLIGELGPCERQACDNDSAVSVKASRSVVLQLYSVLAVLETPCADSVPQLFHGARDGIAHYRPSVESPLHLSLRI